MPLTRSRLAAGLTVRTARALVPALVVTTFDGFANAGRRTVARFGAFVAARTAARRGTGLAGIAEIRVRLLFADAGAAGTRGAFEVVVGTVRVRAALAAGRARTVLARAAKLILPAQVRAAARATVTGADGARTVVNVRTLRRTAALRASARAAIRASDVRAFAAEVVRADSVVAARVGRARVLVVAVSRARALLPGHASVSTPVGTAVLIGRLTGAGRARAEPLKARGDHAIVDLRAILVHTALPAHAALAAARLGIAAFRRVLAHAARVAHVGGANLAVVAVVRRAAELCAPATAAAERSAAAGARAARVPTARARRSRPRAGPARTRFDFAARRRHAVVRRRRKVRGAARSAENTRQTERDRTPKPSSKSQHLEVRKRISGHRACFHRRPERAHNRELRLLLLGADADLQLTEARLHGQDAHE